jgi:hypothetical protein
MCTRMSSQGEKESGSDLYCLPLASLILPEQHIFLFPNRYMIELAVQNLVLTHV